MHIPLDRQSDVPLYKQISAFLRQGIQSGNLAPNTRLPSTRQLSRDLGINRITVENAYAELEADGLLYTKVGSGTYILPSPPLPKRQKKEHIVWPLWQQETQMDRLGKSRRNPTGLQSIAAHPSPIYFDSGVGDARLFPADEFRKEIQSVLRREGNAALGYGEENGYGPLRHTIAQVLSSQGLLCGADNILITAGSQQALALVTKLLLNPGHAVLVERPTYAGALDLFRALRLKVIGVPTDSEGMRVDSLENLLQQHHPKMIYTIPNFQNPTGICLNSQRRRQLIALADRYNVPILEDDFVGDLRYEGHAQPALKSLDPGGRVIYISTFSKMLMPGLRVGFLTAEGPVYQNLVEYKRVNDLATSNLFQRALQSYVNVGRYQTHLRRSCQAYRKRRDTMLAAIQRYLPTEIRVDPPLGGLFIWLCLPETLSSDDLLPLACEEGVSFAPGSSYFPEPSDGAHCLRLNFAIHQPEEIEEGIQRLGKAIQKLKQEESKKETH